MRGAAHLMVSSLAGALALVTCKEPLRASLATHMRLQAAPAAVDPASLEHAVTVQL